MDWNAYNSRISALILDTDALDDLLSELGSDYRWRNGKNEFRLRCPVHEGGNRNCVLRTDGEAIPINWKCYSHHCHNDFKPSLLGLVRGILTCQKFGPWDPDRKGPMVPLKRAIEYLDEFVTNLASSPPRSPVKPPTIKPAQMRLTRRQVRAQLDIPSPYFVSLGFDRAILDAMDVGHSRKLGRSVVPLYDESRHCIGYAARLEMPVCNQCGRCHDEHENCDRGQSKWTLSKGFPKSEYLYGIADVARSSAGCAIVLVEGVKEVWRLREANIPAVACLGSDLSAAQAKRLVSLRRELLVAFDNDQAGRDGARHARERLSKLRGLARILTVPGGFKDLAEMPATAVAEWFRASV